MDKWDWQREAEIQSYFSNGTEVHIAQEQDKLDSLIETFKQPSHENSDKNNVNNSFGENKKLDQRIVMDDVSGVADISKNFANFLTVLKKFGYNCVYFFHVICSFKSNLAKNYFANQYIKYFSCKCSL